jgi:biotin carboxylase
VTEMITGVDLIQEQIRVAQGHPLRFKQEDITFKVGARGFVAREGACLSPPRWASREVASRAGLAVSQEGGCGLVMGSCAVEADSSFQPCRETCCTPSLALS